MAVKIVRNGKSLSAMKTSELESLLGNADKRRKHASIRAALKHRGNKAAA